MRILEAMKRLKELLYVIISKNKKTLKNPLLAKDGDKKRYKDEFKKEREEETEAETVFEK